MGARSQNVAILLFFTLGQSLSLSLEMTEVCDRITVDWANLNEKSTHFDKELAFSFWVSITCSGYVIFQTNIRIWGPAKTVSSFRRSVPGAQDDRDDHARAGRTSEMTEAI
jgi:hypothetical protein